MIPLQPTEFGVLLTFLLCFAAMHLALARTRARCRAAEDELRRRGYRLPGDDWPPG